MRLALQDRFQIAKTISNTISVDDAVEAQFAIDAIFYAMRHAPDWGDVLPHVKLLYAKGARVRMFRRRIERSMQLEEATEIAQSLNSYPLALVAESDEVLKAAAGLQAKKLIDVADEEGWFS